MKVLAIIPDATDGTSFYRGAGPLNELAKNNHITVTYPIELNWSVVGSSDVVFMQRPFNHNHLNAFNLAKDMGKKVVVDFDDDLFTLHPCNGAYSLYSDRNIQSNVRWILRNADHIIVSTEHLKKKYQPLTQKPISVVNNAYDDNVQYYVGVPQKRDLELAFWRGGAQHTVDLEAHMNDMISVVNEGKIPWVIMGSPPYQWTMKLSHDLFELRQVDDVVKYLKNLYLLNPLIGVAPLANIEFNKAKSNIGYIEATISGAAYIGPDFLPEFNVPGIFHYGQKSISEVFNLLLDNRDILEKGQKEALSYVQDTLRLSVVNKKRLEILNEYR